MVRLPFGGRLGPDGEWEADRRDDMLPCLLELRHAFQIGQKILATESTKYQNIVSMKKVKEAKNPDGSALALFLQDAENQVLKCLAEEVAREGARIIGYVFDGLYVMCGSDDELRKLFRVVAPRVFEKMNIRLALKSVNGEVMDTLVDRKRLADECYESPSPKRRLAGGRQASP
jgi:hypothetical protein